MERESSEDLFKRVGDAYLALGSVKKAADHCRISEVKCRRILITLGMWSSTSSRQVAELKAAGLSAGQIADSLHLTVKAVEAYLPYQYGAYGVDEQSARAISGELYRQRQTSAVENMLGLRGMSEDSMDRIIDIGSTAPLDYGERRRKWREAQKALLSTKDFDDLCLHAVEKVSPIHREDPLSFTKEAVYRLRLELDGTSAADFHGKEKHADFCKLAKAEKSISREILVPGEMNLHALHYVIQRAFGWQNSHQHDFSLKKGDFDRITAGRFITYLDLCGVVFAFPNADTSDRCWDDDYKKGISFKTWLKRKYAAPYFDHSVGDSWFGNRLAAAEFREAYPDIKADDFLIDIEDRLRFEQPLNRLTERLTMQELFSSTKQSVQFDVRRWKEDIEAKTRPLWQKLTPDTVKEHIDGINELGKWRTSYDALEHELWIHPEEIKAKVRRVMNKSIESFMDDHVEAIEGWTDELRDVFGTLVAKPTPFINELHYAYDYGDDWHITITVQEVYDAKIGDEFESLGDTPRIGAPVDVNLPPDALANVVEMDDINKGPWTLFYSGNTAELKKKYRFFTPNGTEVDENTNRLLADVFLDKKPCCIAVDGLNVVDDCSGVNGFFQMLRTIYGKDKEESKSMRERANGLGWTGRKSRPENML